MLSFYAKLAAGMTRNTFVAGEAANIGPLAAKWPDCRGQAGCVYPDPSTAWTADDVYRGIYNSRNAANNSMYLDLLHTMLIHDVADPLGVRKGIRLRTPAGCSLAFTRSSHEAAVEPPKAIPGQRQGKDEVDCRLGPL